MKLEYENTAVEERKFLFHKPTRQVGLLRAINIRENETYQTIETAEGVLVSGAKAEFMAASVSEIDEYHQLAALVRPLLMPKEYEFSAAG